MLSYSFKLLFCAVALASFLMGSKVRASDWTEPANLKEGNVRFAARLYQELATRNSSNLFLSPASIHTALAMTYAGARGDTATEMAHALDFKLDLNANLSQFGETLAKLNAPRLDYDDKKPAYQLSMVNALWGQENYPFSEDFKSDMNKKMSAKFESLDFNKSEPARKIINDWVEEQTKTRIKNLIPQGVITPLTRLVLTNAIYFKSAWGDEYFKAANTKTDAFHAPDGDVKVPLMHTNRTFTYTEDENCQVVAIPYKSHELSFFLLLPKDKNGLEKLEKSLTPEKLKQYLSTQDSAQVELTLPKFKIESDFKLKDPLMKLGMPLAFTDKADFNNMLNKPAPDGFYIGEVIHKSFVELNEEGTEAAAATAVVMKAGSAFHRVEKKVVTADHPFLFVIQHRATESVLFMGRVANPAN